ncbi:hypothetical protein THAOC_12031 [Thalassiosira oceanica]|uniref:F-box domain-containing protein n=1 Tax=Thalassiosira oceanica TaxID=159749 RepID=K0SKY3_THAOC|nr:hypothetical protein THAOC_12031 [Thalassiosira oceanica]|eukprot:EJK66988.1 hypothetical protein THAOC_12031 [Thalassiosira oceanica]
MEEEAALLRLEALRVNAIARHIASPFPSCQLMYTSSPSPSSLSPCPPPPDAWVRARLTSRGFRPRRWSPPPATSSASDGPITPAAPPARSKVVVRWASDRRPVFGQGDVGADHDRGFEGGGCGEEEGRPFVSGPPLRPLANGLWPIHRLRRRAAAAGPVDSSLCGIQPAGQPRRQSLANSPSSWRSNCSPGEVLRCPPLVCWHPVRSAGNSRRRFDRLPPTRLRLFHHVHQRLAPAQGRARRRETVNDRVVASSADARVSRPLPFIYRGPRSDPHIRDTTLLCGSFHGPTGWRVEKPRHQHRASSRGQGMEDDSRAKRLKSSEDDVTAEEVAELRARRIAELESEIAQLRRGRPPEGVRELEGNHEVLPVVVKVVVTSTVDLSRITTGLLTHITSFLASSRELLNLALTCKSFGWRQPTSTLNWSLVEEVARQAVCSRSTGAEISCLPQYVRGRLTWLSILHRYEHLLVLDVLAGDYIEHANGDKTAVCATVHHCSSVAVSSSYVMKSGSHYTEFQITYEPCIGVVRPMPDLGAGAYREEFTFFDRRFGPDFLAQRSNDWGNCNVHACEYFCGDGDMRWTDWDRDDTDWELWDGSEGCDSDDTVGMLLNLDEGTLTVYRNNRRLGVMKDGLSGAYCWDSFLTMGKPYIEIMRPLPGLDTGAYSEDLDGGDRRRVILSLDLADDQEWCEARRKRSWRSGDWALPSL